MDMNGTIPAYGLWSLVIINSLVFIIFAFSFTKPKSARDWRTFSLFSAFIIALFTEMYGFPLTIYFLSGWLAKSYPEVNLFSHENGHLIYTLLGFKGDPHFNPFHILSELMIIAGFIVLSIAWPVLYHAQRIGKLATTGIYARMRHPQYVGFILIMLGFLLQWPTIPTLILFPIMLWIYYKLAKREEAETRQQFGKVYDAYANNTPAFFPRLGKIAS